MIKKTFIKDQDSLLWKDFLSGNEEAYSLIYEKYSKKLYIQGLQFTSDRELIKDCIHDIFVKIYKNRATLNPIRNLRVYLFIALRNSIITHFNKQKVYFDELNDDSENYILEENTIEDELINRETESGNRIILDKLLSVLTTRQREAIHYRYFENMSIDEISLLMEMNYQSVQNLIQRSLKKINYFRKNKKK